MDTLLTFAIMCFLLCLFSICIAYIAKDSVSENDDSKCTYLMRYSDEKSHVRSDPDRKINAYSSQEAITQFVLDYPETKYEFIEINEINGNSYLKASNPNYSPSIEKDNGRDLVKDCGGQNHLIIESQINQDVCQRFEVFYYDNKNRKQSKSVIVNAENKEAALKVFILMNHESSSELICYRDLATLEIGSIKNPEFEKEGVTGAIFKTPDNSEKISDEEKIFAPSLSNSKASKDSKVSEPAIMNREVISEKKESLINFLFSINGRCSRTQFLFLGLVCTIVFIPLLLLSVIHIAFYVSLICLMSYLGFVSTVRRLHDSNTSGWFFWVGMIPIVHLCLFFIPGSKGENKYGVRSKILN